MSGSAISNILKSVIYVCLALIISSCGGSKTFSNFARAGDTVALAGGWQQNFQVDNIHAEIRQGRNLVTVIPQGSPAFRASVNLYPDPISSLIVSRETGIEMTPYANTYSQTIGANFTSGDKDWYQTTVFIDLPTSLLEGQYTIRVFNAGGVSFDSDVEIITGVGTPTVFAANGANLFSEHLAGISRLPHHTITFDATAGIPHAISATIGHDPDTTVGGSGKALAVNPTGYKKNLTWTDDGYEMRAILMPGNSGSPPDNIKDFKFYVAGGVQNVGIVSVEAFDIDGNPVPGVTALATAAN